MRKTSPDREFLANLGAIAISAVLILAINLGILGVAVYVVAKVLQWVGVL